MKYILEGVVGLAGGMAVGASVVAFFTVLGVVTRIIEMSGAKHYTWLYEISIIFGALLSSLAYFFDFSLPVPGLLILIIGLIMGIFVGLVAGALTETLDIISTAVTSLNIVHLIYWIVMVILFGKVLGSIIYWVIPGFY